MADRAIFTAYVTGDPWTPKEARDMGRTFRSTGNALLPAGEAISTMANDKPVYMAANGTVKVADAATVANSLVIGWAVYGQSVALGDYIQVLMGPGRVIKRPPNTPLTAGSRYYLSNTAGQISSTVGTVETLLGIAISENRLVTLQGYWEFLGSTGVSVASGNTDYAELAGSRFAIIPWSQTAAVVVLSGVVVLGKVGATSSTIQHDGPNANDNWSYTFAWTGTNINVAENADPLGTHEVGGTIYWYR